MHTPFLRTSLPGHCAGSRRSTCAINFTVAVIFAVLSLTALPLPAQDKKGEERPAGVRTAIATTREVNRSQNFIGTLQPIRRATIGSAVEDRVARLLVDEGDFVTCPDDDSSSEEMAQALIEIDRTTIDLEYESARIALELRKKALDELQLSIPVEIELAAARVKQTEAQKQYAQSVYERLTALGKTASTRELEESLSLYETQSAALASAQAELKKLELTREIRVLILRQNVEAQQSELNRIDEMRSKYTIRAPFSGYVTRVLVEQGSWVSRGSDTVEVIQLDPIEMRINVPQEYLANLQQSTSNREQLPEVTVQVGALGKTFTGNIVEIIPQADERTRAIPVIIRIPNPRTETGHALVPGLLAQATLDIGQRESTVMVPKDALVLGQSGTTVFVIRDVNGQSVAERIAVEAGAADKQWIAITGDVKEGDTVVVQGNERLRPGQTVVIQKDDSHP